MKDKYHYYLFSFRGKDTMSQIYQGLPSKEITLSRIASAESKVDSSEKVVLTGFSYCGYMTKDQFEGDELDASND